MTHEEREAQYVKETGCERPMVNLLDMKDGCFNYDSRLITWLEGFSTWLSARLEMVEKEKR
jgi:hypothetical protein